MIEQLQKKLKDQQLIENTRPRATSADLKIRNTRFAPLQTKSQRNSISRSKSPVLNSNIRPSIQNQISGVINSPDTVLTKKQLKSIKDIQGVYKKGDQTIPLKPKKQNLAS